MPAHQERLYYTYIVASRSHTVYIGMTGNLHLLVFQHKQKTFEGFSADYNCNRLVWFERFMSPGAAIAREKQLKGWIRAKKIALIEKMSRMGGFERRMVCGRSVANRCGDENNRRSFDFGRWRDLRSG
jgi:putative endonuclease